MRLRRRRGHGAAGRNGNSVQRNAKQMARNDYSKFEFDSAQDGVRRDNIFV